MRIKKTHQIGIIKLFVVINEFTFGNSDLWFEEFMVELEDEGRVGSEAATYSSALALVTRCQGKYNAEGAAFMLFSLLQDDILLLRRQQTASVV